MKNRISEICTVLSLALLPWTGMPAADLRFTAIDNGFEFATGELSGKLHAGGKSVGLLPVIHTTSGATLTRSMGLLSHYRVFANGKRYGGGAWEWPSEAKLQPDGSVEVHFAATGERRFEMWATYRLSGPATIDVETRVQSQVELDGFESFLASYFAAPFASSRVYARNGQGKPAFLAAEESQGAWQMFPRDSRVLPLIQDGRWKLPPNPVDWVTRPLLAEPIGVRRDGASGLTAILLSSREDCFAVATPHQAEGHYSTYLSLFGRTVKAGELARARARLVIAKSPTDKQILDLHKAYLKQARRKR